MARMVAPFAGSGQRAQGLLGAATCDAEPDSQIGAVSEIRSRAPEVSCGRGLAMTTTYRLRSTLALVAAVATACGTDDDIAGSDFGVPGADEWGPLDESSSGGAAGDETGEPVDDGVAGPGSLRRLTLAQYHNTLRDLLGEPLSFSSELGDVEPMREIGEYKSIAAARDGYSQADLSAHFDDAFATAGQVFDDADRRMLVVGCTPTEADDACVQEFVARFGRRAFRRPLEGDEIDRYVAVAVEATTQLDGSPWTGLHYATAAMLQSPSMLYLPEIGEPADTGGRVRYTSLEMASRLAFTLTGRGPDDALLDAGEAGALSDVEQIRAHAQRLLDDPRGRAAITEELVGEYLTLDALDGLGKDPEAYPKWNVAVAEAMREEARLVFDWGIFEEDLSLGDLLVNRTTFIDAQLADVYGMPEPEAEGFVRFDIPDNWMRVGVLGLGAFLAIQGKTHRTAPTLRGRFITSRLLCIDIAPPPPEASPLPDVPEGDGYQTMRERLQVHAGNPACEGCHNVMDPPGLALEHFDGIGAHRENDQGLALDVTGKIDGTPFDGAVELAGVLATHPSLRPCLAKQMFRYATGTKEQGSDLVDELAQLGDTADGNFRDTLVSVVTSEGFRHFRNDP